MADVQRRLDALGLPTSADRSGSFGPATRAAVEAFQRQRGLRIDGVCGAQTWSTLVEAGFRLGNRFLYRRTPMLRGDDVADLQQRLSALGFDTGRVDGIFGDATAAALRDFQRNTGLAVDGIAGAATVQALRRLQARHEHPELISDVRAREELRRRPPTLAGRHVAVGEVGGLGTSVAALRRRLVRTGAQVTLLHHPDDSAQAQHANAAGVDLYLGLRLDPTRAGCATAYYGGYRTESPGGRRLAELIQQELPAALDVPDLGTRPMSLPLLRETRMPAVLVEVGPATVAVEGAPVMTDALTRALLEWAGSTWD